MSFPISPAVAVREIDLSNSASEATSSLGAFAGMFDWGPIEQATLVSNEKNLVEVFGKPSTDTAVDFLTIASFFAYTSGAWVSRINPEGDTFNAGNPNLTGAQRKLIKNDIHFPSVDVSGHKFIAKYAGTRGNSLGVITCTSAVAFQRDVKALPGGQFAITFGGATPVRSRELVYTGTADVSDYVNSGSFGDFLIVDDVRYKVEAVDTANKKITLDRIYVGSGIPTTIEFRWRFADLFSAAPASGFAHIVVVDVLGKFADSSLSVLETFEGVSLTAGPRDANNVSIYWKDVINDQSDYVYAGGIAPVASNIADILLFTSGSYDITSVSTDDYIRAYSEYLNAAEFDAPLIIAGDAIKDGNSVLANYLIESVAEVRKDCMVFLSPKLDSVVNNKGREGRDCVTDRNSVTSSSYATLDSGWKYMYDKYNNAFRWVPLNGDHAGIYARVDRDRESWVSAGGTSKGRIKNVVKLAWIPDQTARDLLYTNDINPVTVLPVAGVVMYGDKTLLGQNTAFSRINVRRLFITLEKTIASAAANLLFEFNDEFTQRRFVGIIEPFLRDVKGRRGISDFKVIADSSVNTPQVIQNNRFVGQVYVKPNYSINFIRLDFVAVNAAASFEEVVGSF